MKRNLDGTLLAVGLGLVVWMLLTAEVIGIWINPHRAEPERVQCVELSPRR